VAWLKVAARIFLLTENSNFFLVVPKRGARLEKVGPDNCQVGLFGHDPKPSITIITGLFFRTLYQVRMAQQQGQYEFRSSTLRHRSFSKGQLFFGERNKRREAGLHEKPALKKYQAVLSGYRAFFHKNSTDAQPLHSSTYVHPSDSAR